MAKLNNATRRKALRDYYESKGWECDRWGHMKKTAESGNVHRMKFMSNVIRHEVKGACGWVRINSMSIKASYDELPA